MLIHTTYSIHNASVFDVTMQSDDKRLNVILTQSTQCPDKYEYFSYDSDTDSTWVPAPHLFTLPAAILHANMFFGLIPPQPLDDIDNLSFGWEF